MLKKSEEIFALLLMILFVTVPIIAFIFTFDDGTKKSDNYVICKNVQKLYKDDILFDNFYISCNDTTIEIGTELFARIVEGKDYKVTYNKMGGIYLVEKIDD